MLLVVVGQAEEVLSQTCTRASFPCGLGNGVSIDDRLVGIFLLKKDTCTGGQLFFTFLCFLSPICIARVPNLGQNVCCGMGVLCTLLVWSNRPRNDLKGAQKVEKGHPVPM